MKFDRTLVDLGNISELTEVNVNFIGEREHGERICNVKPSCTCIKYYVNSKDNTLNVRFKTGVFKRGDLDHIDSMRNVVVKCTDGTSSTLVIKYKLVR